MDFSYDKENIGSTSARLPTLKQMPDSALKTSTFRQGTAGSSIRKSSVKKPSRKPSTKPSVSKLSSVKRQTMELEDDVVQLINKSNAIAVHDDDLTEDENDHLDVNVQMGGSRSDEKQLLATDKELFTEDFLAECQNAMKLAMKKDLKFDLKGQVSLMKDGMNSLKQMFKEFQTKKDTLLQVALTREQKLSAQVTQIKQQEEVFSNKTEGLQEELATLTKKHAAELENKTVLEVTVKRLTALNTDTNSRMKVLQTQHASLQAKTESMQQQADLMAAEREVSKKVEAEKGRELVIIKEEYSNQATLHRKKMDEFAAKKAGEIEVVQQELLETNTLLTKFKTTATDLEARLGEKTKNHEAIEQQLNALKADSVASKAKLQAELSYAETKVHSLTSSVDTLQSKNMEIGEKLASTMETFSRTLATNEDRMKALTQERNSLTQDVSSLSIAKQEVEAKFRSLEGAHADLNVQFSRSQQSLQERTTEGEVLRSASLLERQQFALEKQAWEMSQAHLQAQLSEAQERIARLELEQKDTKKDLEASKMVGERLQNEVVSIQAGAACKEAELTTKLSAQTTLAEETSQKLTSTRTSLAEVQEKLDVLRTKVGVSNGQQLEELCALSIEAEMLRREVKDKGHMAKQVAELTASVFELQNTRRKLHNTIQDLKGNIRVVARIRPFLGKAEEAEKQGEVECALNVLDNKEGILVRAGAAEDGADSSDAPEKKAGGKSSCAQKFTFDQVFGPETTQPQVFEEVSSLIQSALDGYNVCLFTYGQTGSGKTYSMQGSDAGEHRGMIPRAIEMVMACTEGLKLAGWEYEMKVSFLEIYNEKLRDLLIDPSSAVAAASATELDIKENEFKQKYVPGLTLVTVTRGSQIAELMATAAKTRTVAATAMNQESSRSHSVFTLHLTGVNAEKKLSMRGSLNLVDLAGSERLKRSKVEGARLQETIAINKSLSALTEVFLALGQSSKAHIPYRNSKLTYLLQNCLSSNGKTLMMVNLSPSLQSVGESICSLRFASQVNSVSLGKAKKQITSSSSSSASITETTDDDASSSSSSSSSSFSEGAGVNLPKKRPVDGSNHSTKPLIKKARPSIAK